MKVITVTEASSFSPEGGKVRLKVSNGNAQIMEYEHKCIKGDEVGVPYSYLNPLQTAFVLSFAGESTLVCSPTSSGKSVIAKLFMDRFEGRKIYVAPTRALVREKYIELRRFYGKVDVRVGEAIEEFKQVTANVVVATYDALVLSLRNGARWTRDIEVAVFDEIHQIFKEDTGWSVDEALFYLKRRGTKILGLSATIYEPLKLAEYIGAGLFILSEWRPTKLIRHEPVRLPAERGKKTGKEDASTRTATRLLEYVKTVTNQGEKTIVFTTKKVGWKALELANMLWQLNVVNESVPFDKIEHEEPLGWVAFHNADVPSEERNMIEKEFNEGKLNLLFATSTLAYGVNTPADKVIIIVTPLPNKKVYPGALDMIQMEGRAGRFGIKDRGEVFTAVSWIKPETFSERFERDLGKRFEESMARRNTDVNLLTLIGILHEKENFRAFLKNFSFNLSESDIESALKLLRRHEYIKGHELSQKGTFSVKSNIPPAHLEEFLKRYKNSPSMEGLEKIFICRPLIKNSLKSALSFFEQFGIEEEIRFYAHKFIGKETEDLSEVLLFYVNGGLFKHKRINKPPAGLELRTESLYLLRSLIELKKQGMIDWTHEEIIKIVHSIAYGLPPEQSAIGSIPGLGFVRGTALARAMRRAGIKAEIGKTVEELISEMEGKEELHSLLEEELSERYKEEKEKAKVLKAINRVLSASKNKILGDTRILQLWAGFARSTRYLTASPQRIVKILRETA